MNHNLTFSQLTQPVLLSRCVLTEHFGLQQAAPSEPCVGYTQKIFTLWKGVWVFPFMKMLIIFTTPLQCLLPPSPHFSTDSSLSPGDGYKALQNLGVQPSAAPGTLEGRFCSESCILKAKTFSRRSLHGLLCCVLFVRPPSSPSRLLCDSTETSFLRFPELLLCAVKLLLVYTQEMSAVPRQIPLLETLARCDAVPESNSSGQMTLLTYLAWIYKLKNDALMLLFLFYQFQPIPAVC